MPAVAARWHSDRPDHGTAVKLWLESDRKASRFRFRVSQLRSTRRSGPRLCSAACLGSMCRHAKDCYGSGVILTFPSERT